MKNLLSIAPLLACSIALGQPLVLTGPPVSKEVPYEGALDMIPIKASSYLMVTNVSLNRWEVAKPTFEEPRIKPFNVYGVKQTLINYFNAINFARLKVVRPNKLPRRLTSPRPIIRLCQDPSKSDHTLIP